MATPEPSSLSQRDVARVEAFTIEADPSNDLEEFVSLPESNLMAGPHALRKIWRVSTVTLSGQSSFSPNSAELGARPSRRYPGGLGDPLFMEQKRVSSTRTAAGTIEIEFAGCISSAGSGRLRTSS